MQIFIIVASIGSSAGPFEPYLVENPEDRFSRDREGVYDQNFNIS